MQLSLQLSKLQGTTSYFDENVGRVGVKSDTVLQSLSQTRNETYNCAFFGKMCTIFSIPN